MGIILSILLKEFFIKRTDRIALKTYYFLCFKLFWPLKSNNWSIYFPQWCVYNINSCLADQTTLIAVAFNANNTGITNFKIYELDKVTFSKTQTNTSRCEAEFRHGFSSWYEQLQTLTFPSVSLIFTEFITSTEP